MKKKIYIVHYTSSWYVSYIDLVKAKSAYQAWKKVKRRHPFNAFNFVSIEEYEG